MREFTQNTYPKLWKPFEHYFPDGLVNSDGEVVTDLLEECTSRDIYGEACHSTWVEVPGNEHYAYLMDRNNPVWREYLKAIIRIQIDAGVAGVQLDEADLPIFATGYGGCFCKDCMKLFRAWLQALPAERAARGARGDRPRDVPLRGVAAGARLRLQVRPRVDARCTGTTSGSSARRSWGTSPSSPTTSGSTAGRRAATCSCAATTTT